MSFDLRRALRARVAAAALVLGIGAAMPSPAADAGGTPRLSFDVAEGLNLNSFLREGPVAAHLVLRSGSDPRVLVAFPAGNSGVGLWFAHAARPVTWTLLEPPQPLEVKDERGRTLHGIRARIRAAGAATLDVRQAVLSSVRVLRDYQALGTFPAAVRAAPTARGSTLTWARDRLDGAPGYLLRVEVAQGSITGKHLAARDDAGLVLEISAASGETPLTPLPAAELLDAHAAPDPAARNALTFLSYHEKFLAGSWRFDTYFGRDTLMSMRLLMPALTASAVDAGLGAVLSRLSPEGEVAHEEDIGEFAILDHLRMNGRKSDAPVFDYKMIDGTFMLAPVAAAWLLDDARGRGQAAAFLERPDGRYGSAPRRYGADLVDNLRLVLREAAKFGAEPRAANLVPLKPGMDVGEWRDSQGGLAGGRVPYDVNAVFVPAALEAAARFFASGLLDRYLDADDRGRFEHAAALARVWEEQAAPLFQVEVPNGDARRDIAAYSAALGIPADGALAAIDAAAVRFHALALAGDGRPIPIVNTDEGFALLFGHPDADALRESVTALMRPFPAGLLTPVGMVVANPVFASAALQAGLTSNAYHGTVVWSWQQAMLAAGLDRQLRRTDLPGPVQELLRTAQTQLWRAIRAGHAMRNSELWSWKLANGRFEIAPFGSSASDADESNAAQLWSTVYLAIPDPLPAVAAP
jgi:hypothetical protein